ncbi:hypothetical protein N9N28_04215 [Rubripirellula amarantea]|nr:hypothetical protein [Rubripirellula amarantea]
MSKPTLQCSIISIAIIWCGLPLQANADDTARARSDSNARYLHHIDLYDTANRKITAESQTPYSPKNTCGRCHSYETISHGWHFNAFDVEADAGRKGEPWIWTDPRTGTQLPLSYRPWPHTFDPRDLGLSEWSMTAHFGARIPGGGIGEPQEGELREGESAPGGAEEIAETSRWPLTGNLEIDCLACHAVDGVYDMNARREQIERQNFAWAPTAALRMGEIKGDVSRIKDGSSPDDEATKKKLPTVTYDSRRFNLDGSVFIDLVREPTSNACYQCHSQRSINENGIEERWIHDEDVHLRAGMQCVDCHRNGIDHDMARGFVDQVATGGQSFETLSCEGCHLGGDDSTSITSRAGRLGSPQPLHEGLPPVHFEKLSCTACHGGPAPREEAVRIMTSLAHGLGEKGHRTGEELPAILAPVFAKADGGKIYPHKVMWPAYWAELTDDKKLKPLVPDQVYDWTRKSLRVRRSFIEEIMLPKLKSSELNALLGPERGKLKPDEWTTSEVDKVNARQRELGDADFKEKVAKSLNAIEKELGISNAVYVSTGKVYAATGDGDSLRILEDVATSSVDMITWPMAHNVRPAGWSLGKQGCVECHNDDGLIFASTVSADGPVSGEGTTVSMATIQGIDAIERKAWNQLFGGRASFKYVIAGSLIMLFFTFVFGLAVFASSLTKLSGSTTRKGDAS